MFKNKKKIINKINFERFIQNNNKLSAKNAF